MPQFSWGRLPFSVPGVTAATPSLVWQVSSTAHCPAFTGCAGDNYKCRPVNDTKAGNTLVLFLTYPTGSTPTITDDNGNTWSSTPIAPADSGTLVSAAFVLANARAGRTTVNVAFGASKAVVQYDYSEWCNVATASPVDNSHSTAAVAGTSLTAGSFSTTSDGALILSYFAMSGDFNGNPTSFVPGGGATLSSANIGWDGAGIAGRGFPAAMQYIVQPAQGAINPSMTSTGDTQHYNCVAVALKAASAGTPAPTATIYLKKIHHFVNSVVQTTWSIQCPAQGNLRVLTTPTNTGNWTSVTDSEGQSWTAAGTVNRFWYLANRSPNPNLKVTITQSGSGSTDSTRFLDIANAAVSPFDVFQETADTVLNGLTTINHFPDITPIGVNELILAYAPLGLGPGFSATVPTGAQFDLCTHDSEIDSCTMENADLQAHYYNGADTSLENWTWTFSSQASNSAVGAAIAFKGT